MRFGDGQLYGVIAVLAILNISALFWMTHRPAPISAGVPLGDDGPGRNFVEIAGDTRSSGIYFIEEGATVRDLLEKAQASSVIGNDGSLCKKLENGAKVVIDSGSRKIRVEKVSNAKRYALHKPMDLNTASEKELMLVPGVGEKTAQAIIEKRNSVGKFNIIDDLMEVPGIGFKKFDKFKEYFFVKK